MVSSHPAPRPDGRERQGKPEPAPAGKDGGDGATITSVCWETVRERERSRTSDGGDGPETL